MRRLGLLLTVLVAISAAAQDKPPEKPTEEKPATSGDRLTLLDGTRFSATITAIDAQGRITGQGLTQAVDLAGLRSVQRAVEPSGEIKPAAEIHFAGGGILRATRLTLGDTAVEVAWAYGEKLSVPIDVVRAVKCAGGKKPFGGDVEAPADSDQGRELFAAALANKVREKDHLLVVAEGKVQHLTGLVQTYHADRIAFEWEGETREIPLSRIYALVLAELGGPKDTAGECIVKTRDGSSASGRVTSLADGKLTLALAQGSNVTLPWDQVTGIAVRSDRMAFLSDLAPVEARTRPIVTLLRPWKADKNVLGGPLKLGETVYEKGIGVQSQTDLVFAQGRRFGALAATIGIDAATQGRGDCEFVVLADGREVLRQRMRGADGPKEIRVATAGAEQVTLVVEPGEDLDLSDHANWCDVRFVQADAKESTRAK
jgi:hypothetical protein